MYSQKIAYSHPDPTCWNDLNSGSLCYSLCLFIYGMLVVVSDKCVIDCIKRVLVSEYMYCSKQVYLVF